MENIYFILIFLPVFLAFAAFFADKKAAGGSEKKKGWQKIRNASSIAAGVAEFIFMGMLAFYGMGSELCLPNVCGMGLSFTLDGFRGVYGLVAAFMWMMTLFFSREYLSHEEHLGRYYFFQLVTLSATLGVFLSDVCLF